MWLGLNVNNIVQRCWGNPHPPPPNLLAHYHVRFHPHLHPFRVDESLPPARTLWACAWGARVDNLSQWIHPELVPSWVRPSKSISSLFHLESISTNPSQAHSILSLSQRNHLELIHPESHGLLPRLYPPPPPPIHSVGARPFRLSTSALFLPLLLPSFHKRVQGPKPPPPIYGPITPKEAWPMKIDFEGPPTLVKHAVNRNQWKKEVTPQWLFLRVLIDSSIMLPSPGLGSPTAKVRSEMINTRNWLIMHYFLTSNFSPQTSQSWQLPNNTTMFGCSFNTRNNTVRIFLVW